MPAAVHDLLTSSWFWLLVVAIFFGLAYSIQKMPTQARPGPRSEQPAVFAWCVWWAMMVTGGMSSDLWEVRTLPGGLALELRAGDDPALVLVQGENRVRVDLAHVKALVAALAEAAADLAGVLAAGGVYHD
jgi:hypothetical protein